MADWRFRGVAMEEERVDLRVSRGMLVYVVVGSLYKVAEEKAVAKTLFFLCLFSAQFSRIPKGSDVQVPTAVETDPKGERLVGTYLLRTELRRLVSTPMRTLAKATGARIAPPSTIPFSLAVCKLAMFLPIHSQVFGVVKWLISPRCLWQET